jgi:hypothetical protein
MDIEKFTVVEQVLYNNIVIFNLIVKKDLPTPLQWRFTLEDIKYHLEQRRLDSRKFGFVMDLRLLGLLSVGHIQEFVKMLESYASLLEEKLIASSIYTREGSIIDVLYGFIKQFYKTKKPLRFVYNIEDGYYHINEYSSIN